MHKQTLKLYIIYNVKSNMNDIYKNLVNLYDKISYD